MNKRNIVVFVAIVMTSFIVTEVYQSCSTTRINAEYRTDTIYTNTGGNGNLLELRFRRGPEHNHPLMALWITDTLGKYIQTLYVAESIAKGVYGHGDKSTGKWLPGPIRRPATLPVWAFNRGVKESDGLYIPTQSTAIPDAYTGATPQANFVILAKTDEKLPDEFYVWFEINQSWDWNNYWTNSKYPDDENYKTSCQPALVYRASLSRDEKEQSKPLELIGHSHYSGDDGEIYTDISTITTAKEIAESVTIRLLK
jgi:hypothetical protein